MPSHISFMGGLSAGMGRAAEIELRNSLYEEREIRQNATRTMLKAFDFIKTKNLKPEAYVKTYNELIVPYSEQSGTVPLSKITVDDLIDNRPFIDAMAKAKAAGDIEAFNIAAAQLSGSLTESEKVATGSYSAQIKQLQKQRFTQANEATKRQNILADREQLGGVLQRRSEAAQIPGVDQSQFVEPPGGLKLGGPPIGVLEQTGPSIPTPRSRELGFRADIARAGGRATEGLFRQPAQPSVPQQKFDVEQAGKKKKQAKKAERDRIADLVTSAAKEGYKYQGKQAKGPDGKMYPVVIDPATNKEIIYPSGVKDVSDKPPTTTKNITQENLEYTANLRGISVEEVKKQLGIK